MADLDGIPLERVQRRHDGLASCRLCSTGDAAADHDWCPAAQGLVCGACCRRVLLGDDSRLSAIAATRLDGDEPPEGLTTACFSCERGHRWFAEQLHDRLIGNSEPC
jgi:hypothetical protein